MSKSMTGYGQAQGKVGRRRILVEVRSVNHKFCEVNVRLFSRYAILENRLVELAKKYFSRGRIDILVREEHQNSSSSPFKIDVKKLKAFYQELERAAHAIGVSSKVDMNTLLNSSQVFLVEEEEDIEKFWKGLSVLLKGAFKKLEVMRLKEGKALEKFLLGQLRFLKKEIRAISRLVPHSITERRRYLEERIQKLISNMELDPTRFSQEVAYLVDRADISEELQRFNHHMDHFQDLLKSKGPLGRKLDFLLQELNREANTLSAKIQNAKISQRVVECKHALEKMREQVQNLE